MNNVPGITYEDPRKPFPLWAYPLVPLFVVSVPFILVVLISWCLVSYLIAQPIGWMCSWFKWQLPKWAEQFQ